MRDDGLPPQAAPEIELMVANANAVRGDARTLTLLMADVQRDFATTMACALDFLATGRPGST